ncbi:MAG TPA: hypothetical protein VGF60_00825 [Xanthobacteraceae bacterium]|jgi:hypothetical protein
MDRWYVPKAGPCNDIRSGSVAEIHHPFKIDAADGMRPQLSVTQLSVRRAGQIGESGNGIPETAGSFGCAGNRAPVHFDALPLVGLHERHVGYIGRSCDGILVTLGLKAALTM